MNQNTDSLVSFTAKARATRYVFFLAMLMLAITAGTSHSVFAQCANSSQFPMAAFAAPLAGTGPYAITDGQFQREYNQMTGAIAGHTFRSTASGTYYDIAGTWITVRAGSVAGTLVAQGSTPLNWTAAAGGTYFIHYNTNSACGTAIAAMTTTVENTTLVCANSAQFPAAAFSAPIKGTGIYTITTAQTQSQYNQMTGAVAGSSFQSTAGIAGTYITVRAGSATGALVAQGSTPLNWTAAAGGTYFIHYNTNATCGTAGVAMTTTVENTTPTCANSTQYPTQSFSSPIKGAGPYTITANQFQREYNQMTGAVAGHTFRSTAGIAGTWITVRAGSATGALVAQGSTPLNWTATAGGTYFIHYNTNSVCGTAEVDMTTTVENTTPVCANLSQSPYWAHVAPIIGAGPDTITTQQFQSEYNQMIGAVAGHTFRSTASIASTYITVRAGNAAGAWVANGSTPLDWTAAAGGTYFIHYHTNSICGNASVYMTTTVENTTLCANISQYPLQAFSAPIKNAGPYSIATDQSQEEYNQMTGAVAGNTFRSTAGIAGTWITVRAGSATGALVAKGSTPLDWTAAAGGTYFIHYNTNSACGTAGVGMTTTVENTTICANSTQFPAAFAAPIKGAGPYTITTGQYRTEYNQMTGALAGSTFQSTASIAGTWITVRAGSRTGALVAQGSTPLNWTATAGGTYFIHYNTNAACGTANGFMTSTVENTTPVCANSTQYPTAAFSAPIKGAGPYTIVTNQFQSEYNQMTGAVAGHTFRSTAVIAGTWITVRAGSATGALVAQGSTPLNWTATAGGTYFIHYNTNSVCGTASVGMTTTVENTTICANSAQFPAAAFSAPIKGNGPYTITTGQFQSQYNQMTGAIAGHTFRSTASIAGTWITVRAGSATGALVAEGGTPLDWTAGAGGTYFIHYNTNSACGTANVAMTTTVENTTSCANGVLFPAAFSAPIQGAGPYTITMAQKQSEYNQMTGAVAGHTFRSTASIAGTWITVRAGSATGALVAQGSIPLNWTAAAGGTYFIHYNTNSACGTSSVLNMQTTIENTTPCANSTQFPMAAFSAPITGAGPYTISTNQFQSEYNQMTGALAGSTFQSTASIAGTYITVRAGIATGALVAQGSTPLNWTAAAGGTYFIHYNTNSACGTANFLMTTTVENICANTTLYPPDGFSAPVKGAGPYTISTQQFQSQYNQMTGAIAGSTFQSTASIAGTWITVRAGSGTNTFVAQGSTPLNWTAAAGGTYFIHYNTNSACGTAYVTMTTTVENTTPVCANSTQYPTAAFSAPIKGTGAFTISTNQFQSQYNQMTGAVAGHTFQSTASIAGTWITVRAGSATGPLVSQGSTPLDWTAVAGGTYFIHYNTNSACGSAGVAMTSTVQNTTPLCVPSTSTETVTACISYVWHGTTYTASNNTATWVTTNSTGCDSIVTLNLTINQPPYVSGPITAGASSPALCIDSPLAAITHMTTGATGILNNGESGANGLPPGVTAIWQDNTITISGTPNMSGVFNYSIPLTGGCGNVYATGTINVVFTSAGSYSNTSVITGQNTTITPDIAPVNAASMVAFTARINTAGSIVQSADISFSGLLTVDPATGELAVTNAKQAGTYTIGIKSTSPSGCTDITSFTLTVIDPVCSQATFTGNSSFPVGNNPRGVAVGDFNSDGKQDIAAANAGGATVSLLLGNGVGGMYSGSEVSVGSNPYCVELGDFNGDGHQDLVAANFGSGSVSIRLGDGAGGFSGTTDAAVGSDPIHVALCDFNNDGNLDIAVANSGGSSVSVLFGNGAGGINGSTEVSVGNNPNYVVASDFNADGVYDIATANLGSGTVSIRYGSGYGTFLYSSIDFSVGNGPSSLAAGDFNEDGLQDIATANIFDNSISIRLNGLLSFYGTTEVPTGNSFGSVDVVVGDFNGDGNLDLATANSWNSSVSIRLGDGLGGFSGTVNYPVGFNPRSIRVGDFNSDGKQDIAAANYANTSNSVSVLLGAGSTITLEGNSAPIINGSASPITSNSTDFGSICTNNNSVTQTYTIHNSGNEALTVSDINTSGTDASSFEIADIVLPVNIAAGDSTTFTVELTPLSSGVKSAQINISSSSCDIPTYSFVVRAVVVTSSATETITSCGSYTWHGTTYTASNNTATWVGTNAAGCDSIVTLNLTINQPSYSTETIAACGSYEWYGTTYTASNNTATFLLGQNAAGCDSIVTLNLTINQPSYSTETIDACGSYEWHGNTYTASNNTATWTGTNASGCDSIVTLNLTITPITVNATTIAACESYTWPVNGQTYTNSGTYTLNSGVTAFYSSLNDLSSAVAETGYLQSATETFESLVLNNVGYFTLSGDFGAGSPTWTASTPSGFNAYGLAPGIAGGSMALTTQFEEPLTISFSPGVTSFGANIFVTNYVYATVSGTITLTMSDGRTTSFYTDSANGFGGYVSHGAYITSITIATSNDYVTIDNLVVSTGTIIPSCVTEVLNLTINQPSTSTETIVACESYEWHGTTYTASNTTATWTGTNAAGCDSIVTLNLTINTPVNWYLDADGDGHYTNVISSCTNPGAGYSTLQGIEEDCDDSDASVWNFGIFFNDNDGDGYGSPAYALATCYGANIPSGYSTNSDDCFDSNSNVYPGATEICNGFDDNCDGIVDFGPLGTPTSVNGPSVVCRSQSFVFTTDAVVGATSYQWTLPSGMTGTSTTNSITVATSSTFAGGNICVRAANSCLSDQVCKTLTVATAASATPGTITGTTAVCANSTEYTYTIAAVANASNYVWTAPANATLVSGQGTTSATFSFQAAYTTGSVSVRSSNCFGTSGARTLTVAKKAISGTPGTVTGPSSFCPGTQQTFSIAAVTGASDYTWTAPANASIVSGQGSLSVMIEFTSAFVSGNVTVVSSNCSGTSAARTKAVTRTAVSATPGTVTGPATVCTNTQQTFSIAAVTGASNYTWTAPTGANILSGQGGLSVVVDFTSAFVSGNLTVVSSNCSGTSAARTKAVAKTALPGTVGTISGATAGICSGNTRTYTVAALSNTTSYEWIAPVNASIVSGQGTTSVVVQFADGFTTGTLSVKGVNCSGTSVTARTRALTNVTATPTVLNGPSTGVCAGTTQTYSTTAVAGATSYVWAVPTGAVINSGQGSTSISVTFPTPFISGVITVKSATTCYTSAAKSLTVRSALAQPGVIAGTSTNLCAGGSFTYTIAAVTGATGYFWNVPAGWIITANTGTSITVSIPSTGFTSATISVAAQNACGYGTARSLTLSALPASPTAIAGSTSVCPSATDLVYSTTAVAGVNYTWTVPTGATITSGQGTGSVVVNWGTAAGSVSVRASNACGINTTARTLVVSLADCRSFEIVAEETSVETAIGTELNVYPNPTTGEARITFSATAAGQYAISIVDLQGRVITSTSGAAIEGNNTLDINLSNCSNGVYMIHLMHNDTLQTLRVVKM